MSRSVKKGPYIRASLLKKVMNAKKSEKKVLVQTYSRESTIVPDMVGLTISVHNGKKFIPIYITEQHVGHKLGEFSPTRIFFGHAGSDRKVKR